MNIEQIKKDWEQHCKHMEICGIYSNAVECSNNYLNLYLDKDVMCVDLEVITSTSVTFYIENTDNYELFISFYKKLLEGK